MNVKRFTARTSRDALALVRAEFGDDAVVMSTRPCAEGVEVLAMAPESVQQLERVGAELERKAPARGLLPAPAEVQAPAARAPLVPASARAAASRQAAPRQAGNERAARIEPRLEPEFEVTQPGSTSVEEDVEQLQMSTLSFQDYVRERMLRRRQAEMAAEASATPEIAPAPVASPIEAARARLAAQRPARGAAEPPVLREAMNLADLPLNQPVLPAAAAPAAGPRRAAAQPAAPVLEREFEPRLATPAAPRAEAIEMMSELRSMRGLIEQRFGALAFMEKLQRQPRQAQLSQRLLDGGFSPALIRKLAEGLPAEVDEITWAGGVLERNLATGERELPLEDVGGVYALIGSTGVGKTTSTAKLAAAFATRHGAANLGLITLDAYRVAAHEQLRAYGRILGVPVHTAHDRASLEDLLELLAGKKMVLIDTAGMAQRDSRTKELLEMLSHRSIQKLLVVNASAQGETIEDQLAAYNAGGCRGVVLSKIDEAVKLGPALDAMIRHKLRVLAVANGQRVPEDWHRLSANALVQRALKSVAAPAWRLDDSDVNLIFAGMPAAAVAATSAHVLHA
jgi:flagellar biosynthesis protein FlhF